VKLGKNREKRCDTKKNISQAFVKKLSVLHNGKMLVVLQHLSTE